MLCLNLPAITRSTNWPRTENCTANYADWSLSRWLKQTLHHARTAEARMDSTRLAVKS